jgi:hypothetical protein
MAEPSLDPENFENLKVALGVLARNRHIDFEDDSDAAYYNNGLSLKGSKVIPELRGQDSGHGESK